MALIPVTREDAADVLAESEQLRQRRLAFEHEHRPVDDARNAAPPCEKVAAHPRKVGPRSVDQDDHIRLERGIALAVTYLGGGRHERRSKASPQFASDV